jgi:hypothetical protein
MLERQYIGCLLPAAPAMVQLDHLVVMDQKDRELCGLERRSA